MTVDTQPSLLLVNFEWYERYSGAHSKSLWMHIIPRYGEVVAIEGRNYRVERVLWAPFSNYVDIYLYNNGNG